MSGRFRSALRFETILNTSFSSLLLSGKFGSIIFAELPEQIPTAARISALIHNFITFDTKKYNGKPVVHLGIKQ